jgi:excisionase family DNA binding protein
MTIQQFAQEQGVEVGRVREAIAAGMIRSIAIGKTVLISHDEYVRLLREAHHGLSVQS